MKLWQNGDATGKIIWEKKERESWTKEGWDIHKFQISNGFVLIVMLVLFFIHKHTIGENLKVLHLRRVTRNVCFSKGVV